MCHVYSALSRDLKIDRTRFEHKSNREKKKKKKERVTNLFLPVFTTWLILNHVNPCFSFFRCWHVLSFWWTILLVYQARRYFRRTSTEKCYRSFYRAFSWNRYKIFFSQRGKRNKGISEGRKEERERGEYISKGNSARNYLITLLLGSR